MKKLLLETSFSKIYMIVMIIITVLILGGYFSYAMFTVSKEKNNAISIVTGNLTYELLVDGTKSTTLSIPANTTKEFTITLNNINNRTARFNFYYVGTLASNVTAGYKTGDGINIPPEAKGINLEKSGTSGSSNTYIIKVSNNTSSSKTINLGVQVGLDYNDLTLPSNGHLFEEDSGFPVAELVNYLTSGDTFDDEYDTFITGEDPNNYIWYSGKLWRAVSVNNEAKTTKLVTQWNISAITYNPSSQTNFEGSYMEEWLNDTTVDGFLGNLRDYENFIVTDAKWNATLNATSLGSITRPSNSGTIVTDAVGLLNMYEYQSSYHGTTYSNGYLNNGLYWWTLTPYSSSDVRYVSSLGNGSSNSTSGYSIGVRPSINLKSSVRIVDGDGTIDNPYRLNGDNDTNLSGTLLSSRYSGEYIKFGNDENNLYRIVSHENGTGTKIVSAVPLKNSGSHIESTFGNNTSFSSTNTIGTFLKGDYLTSYVDSTYIDMIEDSTTWYLGTVGSGSSYSYKNAKYTDASGTAITSNVAEAKVGLLRFGELMSGQFDRYGNNMSYWTLTPYHSLMVQCAGSNGSGNGNFFNSSPSFSNGVRPSVNLKSNVQIINGDGTLNSPFEIQLGS